MSSFKFSAPLTTAMILLKPTISDDFGVSQKTYPDPANGQRINGSFRTFGGTETMVNGLRVVEDTATIQTWFTPEITSECRLYVPETGKTYEVLGTPENIGMRNQYMSFTVRAIGGVV